jgi:hypothetical protein
MSKLAKVGDHVVICFGFLPSLLVHEVLAAEDFNDSGATVCGIPVVCHVREDDVFDRIVTAPVNCMCCRAEARLM